MRLVKLELITSKLSAVNVDYPCDFVGIQTGYYTFFFLKFCSLNLFYSQSVLSFI